MMCGSFTYRSRNDFTERYEQREVWLSHLTAVDFYVSYWSEGLVAHTFVSFIFDNSPPLSISIETRPEVGEGFDPIASLFKQFELIYVVGDESDLVGVRANHRREAIYLYRLNASPDDARRLLLVYLARINELAERPEFYHLLTNSCTINIIRYANAAGRAGRFDIRHLFNGLIDSYLYHSGRIDTTLPFDELRRRSQINEVAQAADGKADFSERIRAGLPHNSALTPSLRFTARLETSRGNGAVAPLDVSARRLTISCRLNLDVRVLLEPPREADEQHAVDDRKPADAEGDAKRARAWEHQDQHTEQDR